MQRVVSNWVSLSDAQFERLFSIFQPKKAQAQSSLLLPGDRVHELIFVVSGLLRFYYLDENGAESNKAFVAENEFAGPLASAALDLPVIYGIQTLETSTLLIARYSDFSSLFDEHPAYDRLGRKFAELLLVRKELRMRSLLQKKAADRYVEFCEQYPDLLQRVPQYHIASYLGITEVSLSRLRRSMMEDVAS